MPLAVFALYLWTMPQQVTFEDDGLFLMAAHFAGIAHPPGYPLYSLLASAPAALPFGTLPIRLHGFSALCGALACLCITLVARRLAISTPAAVAAGLLVGCSAAWWSQSILAEVYALNVLLVFALVLLALPGAGPATPAADRTRRRVLALLSGLALSLHWPLVALAVPALCLLLWPQRAQLAADARALAGAFALGLVPYLWMIVRSHDDVAISFYGPIRSIADFWFIVTRQGYVGVDVSAGAGAADLLRYTAFLAAQAAAQFSWPGFALAGWGFAVQWVRLPRHLAGALTLLFLAQSVALLLLVQFEFDDLSRAAFGVYPLLAWGAMALWLALGLHELARAAERLLRRPVAAPISTVAAGTLIAALLLAQNLPLNDRRNFTAAHDYGTTLLRSLPPDAELFVSGDIATFVPGYLHHVEDLRPDVTLYSLSGIVFANRLFDARDTTVAERLAAINDHVELSTRPICTTETLVPQRAQVDHWLFTCVDAGAAAGAWHVDIDATLAAYYDRVLALRDHPDAWTRFHYQRLMLRAGRLQGRATANAGTSSESGMPHSAAVDGDFYYTLGYLDGALGGPRPTARIGDLVRHVNRVATIPRGAKRRDQGRFLELRGALAELAGDSVRARADYENSLAAWPDAGNASVDALMRLHDVSGDRAAYERLRLRYRSGPDHAR